MAVDANRAIDSVAKLGPGHAIAVLVLLMLTGAGYLIHDGLATVHVGLVELRHEVERSTEHADARAEKYSATQDRILRMLTAVCYAASNGDEAARRRCEDAAR